MITLWITVKVILRNDAKSELVNVSLTKTHGLSSKHPAERDAQEKRHKLLQEVYKQIINGHFIFRVSCISQQDEYSPTPSI